ncbi:MAG TPA: chemotaxis protein CheW [bacterium]
MDDKHYLLFKLSDKVFAIPSDSVLEVGPTDNISRIPFGREPVTKTLNHNGRVLPLLDLGSILNIAKNKDAENFITLEGRGYNISLSVNDIIGFAKSEKTLTGELPDFIGSIIKVKGSRAYLLNIEKILAETEKLFYGGNNDEKDTHSG